MRLPAHQVALAVGEPHEARLLGLLEDPAFQVAGRGCAVTTFCTSVRQVREALGRTDAVDVILVSSTLQAMPHATLRELVQAGRPMVVLAPDPSSAHRADLAVPVLALDADAAALAAALGDALLGRRSARVQASARHEPAPSGGAPARKTPGTPRGEVITVSSAGTPDGRTAAAAVPLAYALSFAAPTVLLDANPRGSGVEFHLDGVDPARGLPQLGRRTYPTDEAWRAALESELQPMGPTGRGWVGCGISAPG